MNEALKKLHMQTITETNAVNMYNNFCAACEMREGGMTDPDQMLVADIAERGIGKERSNGRQHYWQENKSVAQVRAFAEQQRKHLSELRLTPNSRKAASIMLEDEFAGF
jgi:hypothetical protein